MVPILLAEELKRLGHRTEVWADPDAPPGREALRRKLPFRPLQFSGYFSPGEWNRAGAYLRDFSPDVVHLHEGKDLWSVVPALRLSSSPARLIFTQHVGNAHAKQDPLHRWLYGRVDLLFACSELIRRNVLATIPVESDKVSTAYEPVDTHRFRFNASGRSRLRKTWKVGQNPVVGMASRLTPGKGHELLLEAATLLVRKNPKARFVVAGGAHPKEKSYAQGLVASRDRLGLKKAFQYVGHVQDMPFFWSAVDVAVHGANAEAFGMAVAEALSCARPVVAWDGEGTAEILRGPDGKVRGGVLVGPYKAKDWADAIGGLLTSERRRKSLGAQGPFVADRFSLQRFVQFHLKAYGGV